MAVLTIMFLFFLLSLAFGAPLNDLVTRLPNYPKHPGFRMYSGYLNASSVHHLHYVFLESQNDPSTDPVVVWYNGGPGNHFSYLPTIKLNSMCQKWSFFKKLFFLFFCAHPLVVKQVFLSSKSDKFMWWKNLRTGT